MAKLSTEKRNQLKDSDFGIPEQRMYPLHDKAHIESAVKLFGHADRKYKKALAQKILRKAREYNMDTSGWKQVLSFASEQVPPMSDGTSIGNTPPGIMAPYNEEDELMGRAKQISGEKLNTMDTFSFAKQIVSEIHMQYEKDQKPPTGNQNCQLCTWCAEARFRGMNVLPRPVYSPRDPALEIKGENIVLRPIRESFTSQRDVVERVRGAVDSRWYVHVNWKDSTGGHEFLVVNINDYAYIMDAQAGLLKEIDESDSTHNYFRDINFKNSYMARLDNKQFNVKLFNEMNDPSKVIPWKNSLDIPYMRDNGMLAPGDDSDPRFRRVLVPSDEALKYLKEDPELSQYWEDLMKATKGEFLIDRETGEPIGHVFVHTNKKDKGFIFNLEVNPKYRRQGYGWILTDDAVCRFGGEDLTVDADNEPAIQLYLQYGFEIYKKGQWHYDPPKDEYWMKLKASKRPKPIQEAFTDYQEAFDALFILEAEAANQGVLAKIIDWCKRAIQFIISKVKGLFGVKDPVKTNVDINALNQQTHSTMDQIDNGQPVDINKLDQQLATFKNPCEIKNVQEAVKQINANIELINKALNKEGLDQQTATALQKLLTAYMTALKDIQNNQQASQGNKTIIEELKKSILTNNESGSSNIQVYPYLYSRTYYIDFDPIGLVFPTELIKNQLDASKYVLKCVESFGHPAQPKFNSSVTYYNGFYTVLIHCLAQQLAEKVGYKPETFTTKRGETRKKFLNDVVGRTMQIYIGYIVSAEEIKKNGIPSVSYQMLWNTYLKAQEHSFFVPESNVVDENKKRRIPSSLVTVKSNPIPQNTDPSTNKENIKQESFTQEGAFQESTNVFESGHFSKYKDNVLGFNDDGMAVMKKCDCGGNISVSMKGEPVYTCESCGKTYGVVAYQEGAFQDLKNGVNPYSDDLVFHVSPDKHIDGQVWKPRVPDYLDPYNPEDTGFEDNTTPRICFSTSIEGCLNGITVNLQRHSPDTFDKMYVYVPEKPWKEYKHKTNKQLVKDKLVYDANVTREVWIMEPVRMKLYGVIRVDQIADAKRKSVVPTSKGQKDTRNYFTYKWHWVVKPKVLKKATKFDYSPERVIDDLCVDIKKFKYGLIKDGRLMTGNVSDKDYDKYWVFHSGETVDQAGGGNCYDMVEYEAGYLEAFGVAYKKYFMNFTDTKNTKTINTHTICVVPHNGKFIYIEQAFKRVVDEWGYERKKVFDKLNDVFEYVAEVSAEYHNQDLNYGVWDYTNAEIDYGTPIKNFMEWIMTKCKMVYDGEVDRPDNIKKEGYIMSNNSLRTTNKVYTESINTTKYKPLYMILLSEEDSIAHAIRKITNSDWSHCALSLDAGMNKIYSYNVAHSRGSAYNLKMFGGFSRESLFDPGNGSYRTRIYAVYVSNDAYDRVKEHIDELIEIQKSTKYDYLSIFKRIFSDDIENEESREKMVCSSFVNFILNTAGRPMSDKNLPSPQDMDDEAQVKPNECFKVYDGPVREYDVEEVIDIVNEKAKEKESKPFIEHTEVPVTKIRPNRFSRQNYFQEEEEFLSDNEDITVGDLELDDENDNPEEVATDETSSEDKTEPVKKSEEPEKIEPIESFDDINVESDEVPEYMKERLSDDEKEEFDTIGKENEEMDVNNVDLGAFGSDKSDIQNDYDPKEIEILNKLMSSEAQAMNEYMDGAKDTNVDVLRRLYADIANEERFHMEQLLYAKCEMTGEKYVPRDPDVKSEYEELLAMGMDEDTAMQTAVDKCHIKGISISTEEEDDDTEAEIAEEIETMEFALYLFSEKFDSLMQEFSMEDRDKSFDRFVQEAVEAEGQGKFSSLITRNPISILLDALSFIVKMLVKLAQKVKIFFDRIKKQAVNFKEYIKQVKRDPNGWTNFFEPISLYFMPEYGSLNGKRTAVMPRTMYQWYVLAYDTLKACADAINQPINFDLQVDEAQFRVHQIGNNITKGAQLLNSVHLSKEMMVKPSDEEMKNNLIDMFMGYSDIFGEDGKSFNALNSYQRFADLWAQLLKRAEELLKYVTRTQTEANSNPQFAKVYDTLYSGFTAIIKSAKAFTSAITSDINTMIKLDQDVYNAMKENDAKRIQNNENVKNTNTRYNAKVNKNQQ